MLSRSLTFALRASAPRLASPARLAAVLPRFLAPQPAPWVARAWSSTPSRYSAGQTDVELINKLKQEHKFEEESSSTEEPDWLTNFKKEGKFEIQDKPGSDEIALTRKFGNEDIRIVFSIAELEPKEVLGAEEEESEEPPRSGVRTAIIITKENKGGMVIDAIADEDGFMIENVSMYDDAKLAADSGLEADWKRRGLYIGPTFENLDEELQQSFEDFLEERDIGRVLAEAVQDLAENKEQREYVRWLQQTSAFVQA